MLQPPTSLYPTKTDFLLAYIESILYAEDPKVLRKVQQLQIVPQTLGAKEI